MGIRSLFDITFYNMDNKMAQRQDVVKSGLFQRKPVDINTASAQMYLSIPPVVRGIVDGIATVFR